MQSRFSQELNVSHFVFCYPKDIHIHQEKEIRMSGQVLMWLLYFYFIYFSRTEVEMCSHKANKILRIFRTLGIIVAPIWGIISILKELMLNPWVEWVKNGALDHIRGLAWGIFQIAVGLFIFWIFHALAMLLLHKLWPDTYDEHGHVKK